ncbi:hypothetical protein PVAP13_9NG245900 [Panicum virgatum]|uniref:Uncharacterized protein n=1 Tax=Panicum virgatum TaxID=38727 RepID=A0A8T0MNV9_PANVG|nr:hypothetical protein PVAP13_9NG245900 [Panicum virgatum]
MARKPCALVDPPPFSSASGWSGIRSGPVLSNHPLASRDGHPPTPPGHDRARPSRRRPGPAGAPQVHRPCYRVRYPYRPPRRSPSPVPFLIRSPVLCARGSILVAGRRRSGRRHLSAMLSKADAGGGGRSLLAPLSTDVEDGGGPERDHLLRHAFCSAVLFLRRELRDTMMIHPHPHPHRPKWALTSTSSYDRHWLQRVLYKHPAAPRSDGFSCATERSDGGHGGPIASLLHLHRRRSFM